MDELREYLKEHGIKHVYIADKLGISKSYLSLILSGEKGTEEIKKKLVALIKEHAS